MVEESNIRINDDEIEYVPESYFAPLDFSKLFSRPAEVEVDVGCGEGTFLVQHARRQPKRNFIGIERLHGRVGNCCRKIRHHRLENVRMLKVEIGYAVKYLLPPGAVSVLHVMFPDPWPKRRHETRRLVNSAFLDSVHIALKPNGELRLTTDDAPYFQQMNEVGVAHSGFEPEAWEPDGEYPQTDFERRFRARGLPIYRLLLRKV